MAISAQKKPIFEVVDKQNIKFESKNDSSSTSNESESKHKLFNRRKSSLKHILQYIFLEDTSLEQKIEYILYGTRWIMAPIYLLLGVVLICILIKFCIELGEFILVMHTLTYTKWIIHILELLDLTLVANLVVIVALSGYENFVSKIEGAEHKSERLPWLGHVDFSGLKLKIIGSVVAISLIELLQDFLNATSHLDPNLEFWRIVLHLVFVITGIAFAAMEVLTQKRHEMKSEEAFQEMMNKN